MKTKKMFGIAFFIAVIMLSAVVVPASYEAVDENMIAVSSKNGTDVVSDIYLTYNDLVMLQEAIKQVEYLEHKELIQKIIETIENKGFINSDGLEGILIELNMQDTTQLLTGSINGEACCQSKILGIPHIPFIKMGILGCFLLSWHAKGEYINIEIKNHQFMDYTHITQEHKGFALPFLGFWRQYTVFDHGFPDGTGFEVHGRSLFIAITYP